MRWTQLFIPTLREAPADAITLSDQLLVRAGYMRSIGTGLYSHLPLAQRSLRKLAELLRRDLHSLNAQEVSIPALVPAPLASYEAMKIEDAAGRQLALGQATAAALGAIAGGDLRSYKQLPQLWYQIQPSYRDALQAKPGVLFARASLEARIFSLDVAEVQADKWYAVLNDALSRVLRACDLSVVSATAGRDTVLSILCDTGDDLLLKTSGGFATIDTAFTKAPAPTSVDPAHDDEPEQFYTPNKKTIADVAEFAGVPATSLIKSLVMMVDGEPVLALVRGDDALSEAKLRAALNARSVRPAEASEIREHFSADPGSLGPLGVKRLRIVADFALQGRKNMITGANRDDYHVRNVTPGRDFAAVFFDLRQVTAADVHRDTGEPVQILKSITLATLRRFVPQETERLSLRVTDEKGKDTAIFLGVYSVNLHRVLAAVAETHNDKDGLKLPPSIAPYDVVITPVFPTDTVQAETAARIYDACKSTGLDAVLDDRDERPGVKFKDNDLVGIPYRITLGKKLAQGSVEIVDRRTKQAHDAPVDEAVAFVLNALRPSSASQEPSSHAD